MSNKLILIGYGYLAKRVKQQLLNNKSIISDNLYTLSRSHYLNSNHITYDLDSSDSKVNNQLKLLHQSTLLYLVPPPAKGKQDSRLRAFLQNLENNKILPSKIVLISTTGVYGNCNGEWVNEEQTLNPEADRAHRRVDAEQQLQHYSNQKAVIYTILRVSGFYAADKLPLERIKKQLPLLNELDSPFSNRIHADDLSNICCQALLHNHSGIFNCSDSQPSTMADYFTQLAQLFDLAPPPIITANEAKTQLSSGMLSYMQESRRIDNNKLLKTFKLQLAYPSLDSFITQSASIKNNYIQVKQRIDAKQAKAHSNKSVSLLAVSKYHSADKIALLYLLGQTDFGESYIQEAQQKIQQLHNLSEQLSSCSPKPPICWHFIGPIQSNKTKTIATLFQWVHSVDRLKIASRLNQHRDTQHPPINICLQVNINREEQKSGFMIEGLQNAIPEILNMKQLKLRGLMAIPEKTLNFKRQKQNFELLSKVLNDLNLQFNLDMDVLSMGMSNDLEAAISEGATIVRVGTDIFGKRQ